MKKILCVVMATIIFSFPALAKDKEKPSLKIAQDNAVQAIRENPISLPDWWYMTVDLIGEMTLKAIKSGNLNVTITDNGTPGAYVKVWEGENINIVWGLNREGKFVGIEPNHPLWFQKNLTEELKNIVPQLIFNYDNKKLYLAIEYQFLKH